MMETQDGQRACAAYFLPSPSLPALVLVAVPQSLSLETSLSLSGWSGAWLYGRADPAMPLGGPPTMSVGRKQCLPPGARPSVWLVLEQSQRLARHRRNNLQAPKVHGIMDCMRKDCFLHSNGHPHKPSVPHPSAHQGSPALPGVGVGCDDTARDGGIAGTSTRGSESAVSTLQTSAEQSVVFTGYMYDFCYDTSTCIQETKGKPCY